MVVRLRASAGPARAPRGGGCPAAGARGRSRGEGGGELLVERVRAVGPGAEEVDEASAAETIECLFSPLVVDWLLDWSVMRCQYASIKQSNVNGTPEQGRAVDRKGTEDRCIDVRRPLLAAAAIFIGPFVALAALAIRFGVDSRPGVDDPTGVPGSYRAADRRILAQANDPGSRPGSFRVRTPRSSQPSVAARSSAFVARLPAWYEARASGESTSPSVGCFGMTASRPGQVDAEPLAEDRDERRGLHLADTRAGPAGVA